MAAAVHLLLYSFAKLESDGRVCNDDPNGAAS